MSSKLPFGKNLAGAAPFLQDPVSALKLRKDLEDRALDFALLSRVGQIFEGIVLRATQQTEDTIDADDSETPVQFAAAIVRIIGVHDEIIPDPIEFLDDLNIAEKLIEIHPVLFSEEKITGKGLRAGAKVSVRLVNGVFRWAETGGNDNRYNFSLGRS